VSAESQHAPLGAAYQVPSSVPEQDDRTGPAGKLRGVHRDFLLLLLYFPYKDG
jgi:hypothetical protein